MHIHRRLSLHVALFVYLSPNCNASAQREQSLALVLSRLQLPLNPLPFQQLLKAKLSHSLTSYPLPARRLSGRTEQRAAAVIKPCSGGAGFGRGEVLGFRGKEKATPVGQIHDAIC